MDLNDIKQILQILEEQEISEFELEQDGMKLRVVKASSSNHAAPRPAMVPLASPAAGPRSAAAAPGPPAPVASAEAAPGHALVKSPIVGTFFRAPDPNSPPFANVGDRIRVGQVLCIIEAMKLMNEIEAEVAGEIVAIHCESGQPVQYGDPLFTIRSAD